MQILAYFNKPRYDIDLLQISAPDEEAPQSFIYSAGAAFYVGIHESRMRSTTVTIRPEYYGAAHSPFSYVYGLIAMQVRLRHHAP